MSKTLYTITSDGNLGTFGTNKGKLETFTVLDEHYLCEGASVETYLLRDNQTRRKVTASKDLYKESELAAWQEYANGIVDGVDNCVNELDRITKELHTLQAEQSRVSNMIAQIRYNNNEIASKQSK